MDGHDGGHGADLGVGHGHGVDLGFGSHDHGVSHGFDHDGNHAGHVTAEAMMVAHSHCHSHDGMVGHFGGDLDGADLNIGHVGGWSHGEGVDPAKAQRIKRMLAAVEKAKVDPQRRYYGAHIVGHGYTEVPAIFTRAALEAGMMRICNTVANFNPVDLTDTQLSDWSRFTPPYSRKSTPAGFYPNAVGLTRVFKQYWQVANKSPWWNVFGGKAKFDRSKSTYIEVSIVTWFFADIGDYETRVDITVVSLPVLDQTDKVWACLLYTSVGTIESANEMFRGLRAGFQVAASVNLARDLANEPAGTLTPTKLAAVAKAVAAGNEQLSIKVFDHKQLKKMGAHALLAVAQGSDEKPCLIDIVYSPVGSNESDPVALTLIGKSVTFDSGGLDIKAADGMRNMKRDMSGGGVTLAAIQAIAALGLNIKVRCVMAATENMINGRAYKPGDVLQTMKGLTVEVDNTDAEGRLTLADAIEYAKRQGDTTIVDLATLTGAVKMMTGDVGACIFGNNDEFTNQVFSAATSQNERLLPVPMWEEFKDSNRSDMADLKNSGGAPGSTTAAFFLRAFAGEEIKWCHVDIAGVAFRDRDMGPDPRGATGYGVRTLVELATRLAAKK